VGRIDDDTWDIATSVGATAVMVAMARAAETNSANPLVKDQFAEQLVASPELAQVRAQVASWWTEPDGTEADNTLVNRQALVDYMAVRTHFFDAFFGSAARAGIGQYVILAAGLDARAYRLNWSSDTVIYEIDLPAVLDYKTSTLNANGATPGAIRREVGIDLRHDWPPRYAALGLIPPSPRPGWLKDCCRTYRPTTKRRCSAMSTSSPHQAARSLSRWQSNRAACSFTSSRQGPSRKAPHSAPRAQAHNPAKTRRSIRPGSGTSMRTARSIAPRGSTRTVGQHNP
jgi:hypothetical protein